jgi:lipopolysaccharide transport system ATP-binding protein
MSRPAISVENVSKKYVVGHATKAERYASLRDVLGREARNFARRIIDVVRGRQIIQGDELEDFWALDNITFDVGQSEIVGIIGRNGAGKSTLLKILSRITEPTKGRITLRGRVASLLEVGTGFHPELTGRENIFLNGAILGMTRQDIRSKFDEIVAFAEIDRFIDTPVKRYSSGMYVRLAFAIAAHLDPEILLVDEVLAVGDAGFQKRCLGKIETVTANEGRTVLFVSHNTTALLSLCKRGILLEHGEVALIGSMEDVIEQYLFKNSVQSAVYFQPQVDKPSITGIVLDTDALKSGDFIMTVSFLSPISLDPPMPEFIIISGYGIPEFGSNPRIHRFQYSGNSLKAGLLRFQAKNLPLLGGYYTISVWLGDGERPPFDHKSEALIFEFKPQNGSGNEQLDPNKFGYLQCPGEWLLGVNE